MESILKNLELNSIVRVDNTRTVDSLKDVPGDEFNFYVRKKRIFTRDDETWVALNLEHTINGFEILLVEIMFEDVQEFRVYEYVEGLKEISRAQAFENNDWLFRLDEKNELENLGDLDFVHFVDDSEGNMFSRKTKSEIYKLDNGRDCALIEYCNVDVYPPEILIIEEGTLNDNGGLIEFLDGDIIEEFDIKI